MNDFEMRLLKELEEALKEYLAACYGDPHMLSTQQLKEVRQAFLSGIHWRDNENMSVGRCEVPLRRLLGIDHDRN